MNIDSQTDGLTVCVSLTITNSINKGEKDNTSFSNSFDRFGQSFQSFLSSHECRIVCREKLSSNDI